MQARQIVVLGNAFLDTVVSLPQLPAGPCKLRASNALRTGGGIAATAAAAASRLGANVSYWGRLGDDLVGDEILRRLRDIGVDTRSVRRIAGGASPIGTVLVGPDGERMALGFIGRDLDEDAGWLPLDLVADADAVMADYSWWQGAAALFEAARARGIPSVLDADVGDMAAVERLLALPDHVMFSAACLERLTGAADPEAGLRLVAERCHGIPSVTQGERGFWWLDGSDIRHCPAFPVHALDTNGAGDIFHGAFTLGLAEKRDISAAARLASAIAALKCARGSGWESLPDRADVDRLLGSAQ